MIMGEGGKKADLTLLDASTAAFEASNTQISQKLVLCVWLQKGQFRALRHYLTTFILENAFFGNYFLGG